MSNILYIKMIQYIFFDVAGTLLGKPTLYSIIQKTLLDFGYEIGLDEIKNKIILKKLLVVARFF